MQVTNRELLEDFSATYPDASKPLDAWLEIAMCKDWEHLMDIKVHWNKSTDFVSGKTVFNIGGNKYRLITTISYRTKTIRIDYVLTHQEYDEGKWKESSNT